MGTLTLFLMTLLGCASIRNARSLQAPILLDERPTLANLVETVNANSTRVRMLHADNVRLMIPRQVMSLRATLDFERPNRFRLLGETQFTGPEIDLGSNDNSFWMWIKRIQPPTVFHGTHDQFFESAAQQVLPMPPNWLIEALGLVYLDPQHTHDGPLESPTRPGLLQVRTRIPTPNGELIRLIDLDPQHGWVVEQKLYAPNYQLLASAQAADFAYDRTHQVSLPRRLDVQLPPSRLAFQLTIPQYQINQPLTDPMTLFTMPDRPNHRYLDVANPQEMAGIQLDP